MKILQQILFAALIIIGFSLTASAQRPNEGKKERPPKEPVEIKPSENKRPKNNENNNNNNNNRGNENRPKKPQAYFLTSDNRIVVTS